MRTFLKEDFAKFNEICRVKTGKPFAEIALNFPKQVGLPDFEREAKGIRKETIKVSIDEQTQKMSENALIQCHSQDVSMSSNERLWLKRYFNTPTPPLQRKRNALSPDQCNQFDDICQLLTNWPPQRKFIAAEIAREFGIVSTDASHKIKLLAIELGADIPGLQMLLFKLQTFTITNSFMAALLTTVQDYIRSCDFSQQRISSSWQLVSLLTGAILTCYLLYCAVWLP